LWLKGRPVQARPDSMAYRVRKFAGRHVLGIVASVLIALSLVAGLTATLVQAARARREAALARAEAQRAERIKDFTLSLLYEASPVHAAKGREMTAAALLENAAARVDRGLADEPEARAELRLVIAQGLQALGQHGASVPLIERSTTELRALKP